MSKLNNFKYFRASFIVTLIGLTGAFMLGGMQFLFLAMVLAVLEVSLSFDNAVVNATVLKDMSEKWRKRFLTWGILIAVFGMRIVFPVMIVSIIAAITPWDAVMMASSDPELYHKHMVEANLMLMAFGGTFLMKVGMDFFFDAEKEDHWCDFIESGLAKLGGIKGFKTGLEIAVVGVFGAAMYQMGHFNKEQITEFAIGFATAFVLYELISMFSGYMEAMGNKEAASAGDAAKEAAKGGFAMFMYLEVLDSSFSFDGVIGAFAITNNIFLIAIGLGIGAMFVRSLTIMLVEKGTLTEYRYLEHGAFYAIIALGSMMMLKTFMHVPEMITGLIGAGFIGAAFAHSLSKNKQEAKLEQESPQA